MTDKAILEAVKRAVCKAALSSVRTYGDEICCQFSPASRRQHGCLNDNVEAEGPLCCCSEDFEGEAQAAIEAAQPDTKAIQAATEAERKRCAEIARDFKERPIGGSRSLVLAIAQAIEAGEG